MNRKHADANNDGDSYAIASGDEFTGGRLSTADETGTEKMKVRHFFFHFYFFIIFYFFQGAKKGHIC